MKKIRLTKQEKVIEKDFLKGEYINVSKKEFLDIAKTIDSRKKDVVLNIRVNSKDMNSIKKRAKRLGIKYQTLISEFVHRIAQVS